MQLYVTGKYHHISLVPVPVTIRLFFYCAVITFMCACHDSHVCVVYMCTSVLVIVQDGRCREGTGRAVQSGDWC